MTAAPSTKPLRTGKGFGHELMFGKSVVDWSRAGVLQARIVEPRTTNMALPALFRVDHNLMSSTNHLVWAGDPATTF